MAEQSNVGLVTWDSRLNLGPLENGRFICPNPDGTSVFPELFPGIHAEEAGLLAAGARPQQLELLTFPDEGYHAVQIVDERTGAVLQGEQHAQKVAHCTCCHPPHLSATLRPVADPPISIGGGRELSGLFAYPGERGLRAVIQPAQLSDDPDDKHAKFWSAHLHINPAARSLHITADGIFPALGDNTRAMVALGEHADGKPSAHLHVYDDSESRLQFKFGSAGAVSEARVTGGVQIINALGLASPLAGEHITEAARQSYLLDAVLEAAGRTERGNVDLRLTAAGLYATLCGQPSFEPTTRLVFRNA